MNNTLHNTQTKKKTKKKFNEKLDKQKASEMYDFIFNNYTVHTSYYQLLNKWKKLNKSYSSKLYQDLFFDLYTGLIK